ncbi:MAG: trigger factor [Polyangiaceae bacterium]
MQVNVQKLSPVLVEFDVEIESGRVQEELNKAYMALSKSARIKGFRKGKAPRQVLQRMFGPRVAADVAQKLVDESFPKVVSEQQVQPVNNPAIEPAELKQGAPFSYKARFEVVPEIESVEYEGLEAKRPSKSVTDAALDEELEALRKAHSTLEPPKEARASKEGDFVTVDFEVTVDGSVVDDAGATDLPIELGSKSVFAEIEEALIGKQVGDTADATLDMPAGHPHKRLAGNKATFKLTLKELKERVLPALDDEFAKDVDEAFGSLDDLKQNVREQLEKKAEEDAENKLAERLVAELCNKNPVPVPPSLVERQSQLTEREILQQAWMQGQRGNQLNEELRARIAVDSEVKVRAGLLMAAIAKKEEIKIGDPEIEEGLKELAEQTGKNVAKLRAEYREPQKREMLIGMILENKVLDLIEGKAKIEDE